MMEFKQLPLTTRLFNAAMSAIVLISTIYVGYLIVFYIRSPQYTGTQRWLLVGSLVVCTLALIVFTADSYDYLMHAQRKFKIEDVRKVEVVALIALGVGLSTSALVVGLKLFVTLVPAVIIYTLLVVRPSNAEAHTQAKKTITNMRADRIENRGKQKSGGSKHSTGSKRPSGSRSSGARKSSSSRKR